MEESKKVWVTGSIILILLVAVFLIYFLVISPSRKIEEEPLKVEEIKTTAETEIGEEKVRTGPESFPPSLLCAVDKNRWPDSKIRGGGQQYCSGRKPSPSS